MQFYYEATKFKWLESHEPDTLHLKCNPHIKFNDPKLAAWISVQNRKKEKKTQYNEEQTGDRIAWSIFRNIYTICRYYEKDDRGWNALAQLCCESSVQSL